MSFADAVKICFTKYVTFSGRAPRSEFWWFMLLYYAGGIILSLIYEPLGGIFGLATFVPYVAVTCRRLHDIDRSGWWMLLPAVGIPFMLLGMWMGAGAPGFVGIALMAGLSILLIVWYCKRGTDGDNRFGPSPLAPAEPAAQPA